jgi:hypothetical protein
LFNGVAVTLLGSGAYIFPDVLATIGVVVAAAPSTMGESIFSIRRGSSVFKMALTFMFSDMAPGVRNTDMEDIELGRGGRFSAKRLWVLTSRLLGTPWFLNPSISAVVVVVAGTEYVLGTSFFNSAESDDGLGASSGCSLEVGGGGVGRSFKGCIDGHGAPEDVVATVETLILPPVALALVLRNRKSPAEFCMVMDMV